MCNIVTAFRDYFFADAKPRRSRISYTIVRGVVLKAVHTRRAYYLTKGVLK